MIFTTQLAIIGSDLVGLGESDLFGWHSSFVLQVNKLLYCDQNAVLANALLHC